MIRYTIYVCSGHFRKADARLILMRDALYPDGIEGRMCGAMTKYYWLSTWSPPTARFREGPKGDCVNEYAFHYNHRDDPRAMFSAVVSQAKKVRSGNYGEYSPIGEG
jgi:hypothetical protein